MESIVNQITHVRKKSPLVHSITNYVVMNTTANALLAIGASPIMAHAEQEVADVVKLAQALVINIGTLDESKVKSMHLAIDAANSLQKPWVLDPVGAGATEYRNKVLADMLVKRPTVIRGNASEIMALTQISATTSRGVDSANTSDQALEAAIRLSGNTGAVVCVSGERDYIIHGAKKTILSNGSPLMAKVTGMGCTATAIIGAFLGAEEDAYEATVAAMVVMGVVGEIAAGIAQGPGSLQMSFYDVLYSITPELIAERAKIQ